MKRYFLLVITLLTTLTTQVHAKDKAWVLSDDEVRAEQLEARYGCSAIFDIERDWHTVYSKNGCKSFVTPKYGYAIEQTQKEIIRLKLHRVYMRIQSSKNHPSGRVIDGAGKYSEHIIMSFLLALIEYDQKIKPAL